MSSDPTPGTSIPARVTVEELASATGVPLDEVQALISARGEPSSPDDLVGAELALSVGRALGVPIAIEPRDLALEHHIRFDHPAEAKPCLQKLRGVPRAEYRAGENRDVRVDLE